MTRFRLNGCLPATRVSIFCLSVLAASLAVAQHSHGILTPGVTFPKDDSVLTDPPRMITMSFRVDVRLLKLALYSAEGQWINIGFTYDPNRMNNNFVLPIPEDLPTSAYYIAQWSVTDDRRGLVNGEFRFAFGPGAVPPSETIDLESEGKVEVLPETGSYRTVDITSDSK
ncbi:MAG: hypothetical protein CMD92_04265 [Gammaproteobacteria bacterium]|nr:hypothetical protein [Gammaproteobacteria bacterium]HBW83513.1 hypothetical protein [Gammaproteobacteria bacterium]|tara:strand:+ start:6290 stop:6799 length:510 start_codon:yes stop_codon:yes gene_type:complete